MNRITATILMLAAGLVAAVSCRQGRSSQTDEEAQADTIPEIGFRYDRLMCDSSSVHNGDSFTGLMGRLGLSPEKSYALSQICDTVFDVRKLRAGNSVEAYYSGDSLAKKLEYAVYHHDKVSATVFQCGDSLAVWRYDKPVTIERKFSDITITSSLWNDMKAAGASTLLIMDLSDVYAWTVNFFGLQDGDRFRAIYRQKVCEGEVISIEGIDFALYESGSFKVPAILFDQHDGGNRYWNEKGESMRKAFLKAPLQFTRISSRFTYHRKHPVTGVVRAHTAVDYAAPKGTPVHSIGDGTITICGWDSHGGGNRIRIRHMNGYETSYMHLSGYASGIRAGAHVSQGQTIGYVGSTGLSTGPHLDFRVWKDGTPVDPLKMVSPPSEPLNSQNRDSLNVLYHSYMKEIGAE